MQTIQSIKLKGITSKIGSGATPRGGKNSYITEGIALIRSLNVYDFSFAYEGLAFIDEKQATQLENVLVERDDILLNITGASVCRCCLVPKNVLPARVNQHVSIVRIKPRAASAQGGATREALTKEKIENFEIPLPPLPTQLKIAAILSAYDDLIENNLRRIKILEEMAQTLYREWFVKFRFPGHQKVKMVDSPLGKIPEGWEYRKLGDLLSHHVGGGWGEEIESEKFPIGAYVIRGTDIPEIRTGSMGKAPIRFHKESNFKPREIQPGDIVFEVSGGSKDQPVGRGVIIREMLLAKSDRPAICASFCRLIRADQKKLLPDLLNLHFDYIYENREIMKYQTQSTGITNFKFTVFLEKELVLVPTQGLQERFSESALPMLELATTLGIKNHNLRQTRDLLLPKLISGQLDVNELDIRTAENGDG